jgi:hypothetical protein
LKLAINTGKLKVNLKTFMQSFRNKVKLSPQLRLGVGRGFPRQNYLKYIGFGFLGLSLILTGRTIYLLSSKTAPNPQVLGAEDQQQAQTNSGFIEYKVKTGDTIFNIGQTYKISWTTIATLNGLSSPFTLKPGQVLKIPQQ